MHFHDICHFQVSTIAGLHGDKSKLNACVQLPEGAQMTKDQFDYFAREMESILSLRLPDDTYRGLLNIIKAYQTRTPKNEIENSLVSDQKIVKSLEISQFLKNSCTTTNHSSDFYSLHTLSNEN